MPFDKAQHNREYYAKHRDRLAPIARGRVLARGRRLSSRTPDEVRQARHALYPDGLKRCSGCTIAKPFALFHVQAAQTDGLAPQCLTCRKAKGDAYRERTRNERLARRRIREHDKYYEDVEASRAASLERYYRRARRSLDALGWNHMLSVYAGLCAYCGARPADSVDHIVPVARGGRHSTENILPACISCNCAKRKKTALEFILWRLEVA